MTEPLHTLYCSFCGKSQHEVRKLIAGPTVFICDECVDLMWDITHAGSKMGGREQAIIGKTLDDMFGDVFRKLSPDARSEVATRIFDVVLALLTRSQADG